MTQGLTVGVRTDKGRVREANEDNVGRPPDHLTPEQIANKGQLYAVADGMGGHQAGALASATAIEALYVAYYGDPTTDVRASLHGAMLAAAQAVYGRASSDPAYQGMGTTLVAAVVRDDELTVANVGDSRAYLVRKDGIRQLTLDHSWVAAEMRAGVLTPEEARAHPRRNVLTRSLGKEPQVEIDVFESMPLSNGDVVILCSDGLHGLVSDGEMASIVRRHSPPVAVDWLVDRANRRGGEDNISAIVIAIGPPAAEVGETTVFTPAAVMQGKVLAGVIPQRAREVINRLPVWLYALAGICLIGLIALCCLGAFLVALSMMPGPQPSPTPAPPPIATAGPAMPEGFPREGWIKCQTPVYRVPHLRPPRRPESILPAGTQVTLLARVSGDVAEGGGECRCQPSDQWYEIQFNLPRLDPDRPGLQETGFVPECFIEDRGR